MPNFWRIINKVISDADVLLEVLDARLPEETRNLEIELKVARSDKPLIFVINKCDLIDKTVSEKIKKTLRPSVFLSARERLGISKLRELILSKSGSKKIVQVGVLGYPNTGKSSVINALAGRSKAKTSSVSGYTKGKQDIRVSRKIKVIDTPGAIPWKEKDNTKHAITSSIDYSQVKIPDLVVMDLMEKYPGRIESYYGIETTDDPEEVISRIAFKLRKLKKKGEPDIEAVSRLILKQWQKGEI